MDIQIRGALAEKTLLEASNCGDSKQTRQSHFCALPQDLIPLPNVSGRILAKVIEYCKYHVEASKKVEEKVSKTDDDIKASTDLRVLMLCLV